MPNYYVPKTIFIAKLLILIVHYRAFKLKNVRARAILVARAILTFNKLGVFTVFPALFLVVPLGKQTWRPK